MNKNKKNVKTLNRGEKMKQRKVKKQAIYVTLILSLIAVISIILSTQILLEKEPGEEQNEHVNKTVFERETPVVVTPEIITRPYTDSSITIKTRKIM